MEKTIQELVKAAKKQDAGAFAELYEMVYKDMYAYAFYMLRGQQDAEDVVSDTVMYAFETIGKLRNPEKFRLWIFAILANQCRRKRGSYVNEPGELTEDIQQPQAETSMEERQDLERAFAVLSEEEKTIVNSFVFAGFKGQEIAERLSLNPSTVRSKYRRALEKMRKYLEGGVPA